MPKEVERKFLVKNTSYREMAVSKHHIIQGYLCREPQATVRVRILDQRAFLTVKGTTCGCTRNEWEYEIPFNDAREMLCNCCGAVIDKTRHIVPAEDGLKWEIDEFHNVASIEEEGNAMLTVAEIELPAENHSFLLPDFIGKEVSADPRYYNSNLTAVGN